MGYIVPPMPVRRQDANLRRCAYCGTVRADAVGACPNCGSSEVAGVIEIQRRRATSAIPPIPKPIVDKVLR